MQNSSNQTQLLTRKRVTEHVGLSATTIYNLIKAGEFPKPHRVGARSLWRSDEIAEWIDQTAPKHETSSSGD